jgi:asparagine synthase (glutamine-hydrolysing)
MCGIFASVGPEQNRAKVDAALQALSKRGPDSRDVLMLSGCTLAQTRLAIIDLSPGGHQPKRDNRENIAITFNGEIYNYRELRASLTEKGHTFSTESDTEVILKCYLEYGERCPEYLDGMFAFAIWNEDTETLFMARDRFGKKPLFYHVEGNTFTAASEIKALCATGIRGKIDPAAIDAYLALTYVPPWRTIYTNIHVVLPGHSATFTRGALTTRQYWELTRKPIHATYEEAKDEVRRLLTHAVTKRMLAADVEVGSLLSGGVDSTIITAYAQKHLNHPIKTFALGYGDAINELPFAKEASDAIGTDHHTLEATRDHAAALEELMTYFDEPHGDTSNFPQHLISKLAASNVKVALSGDGGDELFLGYGWYWRYWNRPKLTRIKNALFGVTPYDEYLELITCFPKNLRAALLKDAGAVGRERISRMVDNTPLRGIEKINAFDMTTYLPGQLLSKVDQTSMMHSLEIRCPFLDHTLAEYVVNLPEAYKTDRKTGKIMLKDLLAEIMPRAFVDRKKQGFGAPIRAWLEEDTLKAYVHTLFGGDAQVHTFLKKERIDSLVTFAYQKRDTKAYHQLWVLLCLEVWLRTHKGTYDVC